MAKKTYDERGFPVVEAPATPSPNVAFRMDEEWLGWLEWLHAHHSKTVNYPLARTALFRAATKLLYDTGKDEEEKEASRKRRSPRKQKGGSRENATDGAAADATAST